MNLINEIIVWFKKFFLSFYKSEQIIEEKQDEDIVTNVIESNNYIIKLRGYIKDYSIINVKITINDNETTLPYNLAYKEECVLETNCDTSSICFTINCGIQCIDGYTINNLSFTKMLNKGETIIYITDTLLGLKPIVFGNITVEDFIPINSKNIIV